MSFIAQKVEITSLAVIPLVFNKAYLSNKKARDSQATIVWLKNECSCSAAIFLCWYKGQYAHNRSRTPVSFRFVVRKPCSNLIKNLSFFRQFSLDTRLDCCWKLRLHGKEASQMFVSAACLALICSQLWTISPCSGARFPVYWDRSRRRLLRLLCANEHKKSFDHTTFLKFHWDICERT